MCATHVVPLAPLPYGASPLRHNGARGGEEVNLTAHRRGHANLSSNGLGVLYCAQYIDDDKQCHLEYSYNFGIAPNPACLLL
jgi:hypothetical protein